MDIAEKYGNSSFWLDRFTKTDYDGISDLVKSNNEYYRLASQKKAISNFVSIVTNQKIPVKFTSSGDSYTDGSTVVISSKLNTPSEFDVAVGLALHEGSHIKLSDFKLLSALSNMFYELSDSKKLYNICRKSDQDVISILKDILNWVEDRRIDNFIYETSPGYRAYYTALYDKYFNDSLIDKALKSKVYTDETFDSYMFRLINLHSNFTKLNALKGLGEISKIADLPNIGRLQNTQDAFDVAVEILRVICRNVEANQSQNQSNSSSKSKAGSDSNSTEAGSDGKSQMDDETFEELLDSLGLGDDNGEKSGDINEENGDDSKQITVDNLPDSVNELDTDSNLDETNNPSETVSLTDKQKEILDKKIKSQKEFIRGEISKSKLSESDIKTIDIIEKSGTELIPVATDYISDVFEPINCVFVKNMNMELMMNNQFPLTKKSYSAKTMSYELTDYSGKAVLDGIRLGTILGKKMQVRSESRETIFNRQLNGKIDKRMIASLGYGNTQAFFTKELDMYNKVNLHISIDASSSMGTGTMWIKTMTNVIALAKAVDMIPNIEIQISFRTTDTHNNPYIVIAYDSRKDKFSKIKQLFPYLRSNGTTPEGLCFEAIKKYMISSSNGLDSFFLNISDGEPYYIGNGLNYSGMAAASHIKKMMDSYRNMGIGVLSYFVSKTKDVDGYSHKIFTESYGKSAKFIDVTSVNDVSKTMNKLFMEK